MSEEQVIGNTACLFLIICMPYHVCSVLFSCQHWCDCCLYDGKASSQVSTMGLHDRGMLRLQGLLLFANKYVAVFRNEWRVRRKGHSFCVARIRFPEPYLRWNQGSCDFQQHRLIHVSINKMLVETIYIPIFYLPFFFFLVF